MRSQNDLKRKRFFLIVLGIIVALLVIREMYLFFSPQASINFTQFAPTVLPDNLTVKHSTLQVYRDDWRPSGQDVQIVSTLSDQRSTISLKKAKDFDLRCDKEVATECSQGQSRNGVTYQYQLSYFQQKPSLETVMFIKDGTCIIVTHSTKDTGVLNEETWSDIIDSFQPTTFKNLDTTILRTSL